MTEKQTILVAVDESKDLVEIPPTALVACPLKGFNLARVERCPECQHFAGLADRFPDGAHEFKVRYLLQCNARPTSREIKELA